MIVASIDIGTNTVLLLIADIDSKNRTLVPLLNEYRIPRIGQDTKQTGIISNDKLNTLYDVLTDYDRIIKKFNVEKVILIGTNAFRMAKNTPEIITDIRRLFNFELRVISGDTEAEYAFLGATSNLAEIKSTLVIDIGGSSTEFIFGDSSKIHTKKSIQIGSVSLTEQFFKHSPPIKTEIEKLRSELKNLLRSLTPMIPLETIIATAGTATTLSCMKLGLKEFNENKVDNSSISKQDIKKIINELSVLSSENIFQNYGSVMKGREDIIFAGAIILDEIINCFNLEKITISTRGIRYGAIIKYLDRLN